MLPAGPISVPDLVTRLVPLYDAYTTREADLSDEERADMKRIMNRLVAEYAHAKRRQWAERVAAENEGSVYIPNDWASNMRETAPYLYGEILRAAAAETPENIAALMDKTADWPR